MEEERKGGVESLGWLTESAILPKRHKAIEGVGPLSILELKAQFYQTQEEAKKNKDLAPDVEFHCAKKKVSNDIFSHKNSGVEARAKRADEEIIDQKIYLEELCKPKCVKAYLEYRACVKRIQDDETGHKHCTGQYFDYWYCVDKCVAPRLFEKLK